MEKKKIRETEFATYFYDKENELLEEHWDNSNGNMSTEGFKKTIVNYMELVNLHTIQKSLINTKKFNFLIDPKVQEWQNTEVFSKINKAVERIGFIVPDNIFEQVAIEQVMDESDAVKNHNEVKYFTTEVEARTWLLS